jgi:hypothetical protein
MMPSSLLVFLIQQDILTNSQASPVVHSEDRHILKFPSEAWSHLRGHWNGSCSQKWHEGKKSRSISIALKFSDFWFQLNSEITCRLFSKNFLSIGLNPIHTCWIVKLGEMSHALMSHGQMCLLISHMLSFCALNYGLLNCDMLTCPTQQRV